LHVETVDVITPIVDDPFTFGAICAANSVSDIYAMGGTPLTALAILGYASCDFSPAVIKELFRGSVQKLKEAGACLIGGHSIEDNEFKLGFAVTGIVQKRDILRVGGARAGDLLVLTKQIGTGILTSAVKLGKMKPSGLKDVIDSMLLLNKTASRAAVLSGAHAATDVTGFGLLGHALNMARSSGTSLTIVREAVPFMKRMLEFISAGVVPKGAKKNLDFCRRDVSFPRGTPDTWRLAFSDPQTSGGLLIALPEKGLKRFDRLMNRSGSVYWTIGTVARGKGRVVIR
jgi:selenide,water dikinase